MSANINGKALHIFKRNNVEKEQAVFTEIERLLGSLVNDDGDEVAQFQADEFITEQFCMVWPKKKRPKTTIRGIAEAVALQEHMGYQSCFASYKMDNNHNRQECVGTIEDTSRRIVDIVQNSTSNESGNHSVNLAEAKPKELDSLLQESYEAYRLEHYGPAATKYKMAWEMMNDANLKLCVDNISKDVVCYVLCLSLIETNQLNNLLEATELLAALQKRSSHVFPAVYYALSKAHHKHYRFTLALKAVEEGFAFLQGDVSLTKYTIPGSNVTLKESTKEGLSISLAAMKDECSKWHPPDAVCCVSECPHRDIYFSDPAFNGMVVLTCSNTRNPCTMKFHQACWKLKKEEKQLSALKKLSDKDILGYECFTPNCESSQGNQNLITRVDIYGGDGKLKTSSEAPANPVVWGKRRPLPKGAIPKQQVKPKRNTERIRRPVAAAAPRPSCKETVGDNRSEIAWRMAKLASLRVNNFGRKFGYEWQTELEMYGNSLESFENDSPKIVAIKTFIFTYFYEFIKENGCVKKSNILQKWEEDKYIFDNYNDVLNNETDICEFLLQSCKLVSLGDYISIAENLPELFSIVRSEVCGCLKFLLANQLQPRATPLQDDVFNVIISDYDDKKTQSSTVVVRNNAKISATVSVDRIQPQVNVLPPVVTALPDLAQDILSKPISTNSQETNESIDFKTCQELEKKDVLSQTSSGKPVEPEEPEELDEPEEPVALVLPVSCNGTLERNQNNSNKLDEIRDTNHCQVQPPNNRLDHKFDIDSNSSHAGSQSNLNAEEEKFAVELLDDSDEEEISHDVCSLPQESESNDRPPEVVSNKESGSCDSDLAFCELICSIDCMDETNQKMQVLKPQDNVTTHEPKFISDNNDESDKPGSSDEETSSDIFSEPTSESSKTSYEEDQVHVSLTTPKIMDTANTAPSSSISHCRDTLAETNVKKIENDLAVMVKTLAQLKSVLEQNQVRSENHAQMLEREYVNHKMVSQKGMSELLKDLSRLEARCAQLESDKLEIKNKFEECQLDLVRTNDSYVSLKLENTELMCKYEKLCEANADTEHNLSVLLKEKSVIENHLEIIQRERDKMDKKLQKYQACLKAKSYVDSQQASFPQTQQIQSEQQTLEITRLNDRKLKLESLKLEFNLNEYALKKAFEKCDDHISMLTDVNKLIGVISGQPFFLTEAQTAWQQTQLCLRHTMEQYQKRYLELVTLLESDKQIEKLNEIKLPAINIVYPQLPSLMDIYFKGNATFMPHQMPGMQNLWPMQGVSRSHSLYSYPPPNLPGRFYTGPNLEPRMNELRNALATNLPHNKLGPQNLYHGGNSNKENQARNGGASRMGCHKEIDVIQQGIIADTKPSSETQDVNPRVTHENALVYDAKGSSQVSNARQSTPIKKIEIDMVIQELRKRFVGVPELDLRESLEEVRKQHHNTLSGMRMADIIQESVPFVRQHQEKHMASYSQPKRLQPNVPGQRKIPPLMQSDQQKKVRGNAQDEGNKPGNHPSKVSTARAGVIKKSPWQAVRPAFVDCKEIEEDSECSICLYAYDNIAPVYILPCKHAFHTKCIRRWLGESSVCPKCRMHCTMDDEFPPLP